MSVCLIIFTKDRKRFAYRVTTTRNISSDKRSLLIRKPNIPIPAPTLMTSYLLLTLSQL